MILAQGVCALAHLEGNHIRILDGVEIQFFVGVLFQDSILSKGYCMPRARSRRFLRQSGVQSLYNTILHHFVVLD